MANFTKRCSGCKLEKSLDNFSNNKRMVDGKNYYCKDCRNSRYNYYEKSKNKKKLIFSEQDIDVIYQIVKEHFNYLKNDSDAINNPEKFYNVLNIKKIIEDFQKNY